MLEVHSSSKISRVLEQMVAGVLYSLLGGGNVDGNILGAVLKKRVILLATTLRSRSIEVS